MSERDLWGQTRTPPPEHVRLYGDEIKAYRNSLGEQWMYIGLLGIPEGKYQYALDNLTQDREQASYPREVHFTKLRRRSDAEAYYEKTLLAKRWTDRVLRDGRKTFHFSPGTVWVLQCTPASFRRRTIGATAPALIMLATVV